MLFVDNQEITDPSINIALETYLVENRLADEPMLLFYINEPSIIIGRNQNTVEEVNQRRRRGLSRPGQFLILLHSR